MNQLFEALVLLSFPQERMVLNLFLDTGLRDDGSRVATEVILDFLRFQKDWMGNGVVEIWNPQTGKRLGRSAPVMLVNAMPNWDQLDREAEHWRGERDRRVENEDAAHGTDHDG